MNPRPLGYEPYDIGLWRLGPSLVTTLASADLRREVFSGLLHLPPFHRVPLRPVYKSVYRISL